MIEAYSVLPFALTVNGALCCWDIYLRVPTAGVKFIINCSLFLQKFKGAGDAETKDWLCFFIKLRVSLVNLKTSGVMYRMAL